jgi:hypothetical protein
MRTSLDIPAELIKKAQHLGGLKNKTTTIIVSLQEFINNRKMDALRQLKGNIDLKIDLPSLRDRKSK